MDDNVWNRQLEQIFRCVNEILENPGRHAVLYGRLRGMVMNYCSASWRILENGKAELLYLQIKSHILKYLTRVSESDEWENEDTILPYFIAQWKNYKYILTHLKGGFADANFHYQSYLERDLNYHIPQVDGSLAITLALNMWNEIILQTKCEKLNRAILKRIENYRKGLEIIDYPLIHNCIQSYFDGRYILRIYQQRFEKQFLEETELFYSNHFPLNFLLEQQGVCDYIKKVDKFLNLEYRLTTLCLHNSTWNPVMNICEKILITSHSKTLCDEFLRLLRSGEINYLRTLYNVMSRSNAMFEKMLHHFGLYVKGQSKTALNELDEGVLNVNKRMVRIFSVHHRSCKIVAVAFRNDPRFLERCDAICVEIIKYGAAKKKLRLAPNPGHYLAHYFHSLWKKFSKNVDDQELEVNLGHLIRLLKYLDADNLVRFKAMYKGLFCDRLTTGKLASDATEKTIIMKLGIKFGFDYACELRQKYRMLSLVRSELPIPHQT